MGPIGLIGPMASVEWAVSEAVGSVEAAGVVVVGEELVEGGGVFEGVEEEGETPGVFGPVEGVAGEVGAGGAGGGAAFVFVVAEEVEGLVAGADAPWEFAGADVEKVFEEAAPVVAGFVGVGFEVVGDGGAGEEGEIVWVEGFAGF